MSRFGVLSRVGLMTTMWSATQGAHGRRGTVPTPATLLALYFSGGSLPAGVTDTGGTNGTRVNIGGTLVVASAARFDYSPSSVGTFRGLLYEPAQTNLLIKSEDFSTTWTPVSGSVTANTTVSPDGNTTADTFAEDTSTGRHILYQAPNIVGGIYEFSVYVKAGTGRYIQVQIGAAASDNSGVIADLQTGTITDTKIGTSAAVTSSSIQDAGGGWYRIVVRYRNASGGTAIPTYAIIAGSDSATPTYDANLSPTYAGTGRTWRVWGAQLTTVLRRTGPVSYIPTAAATVTRAAEVMSITIPSGVTSVRVTADDSSTEDLIGLSAGSYTMPINLYRPGIKSIVSVVETAANWNYAAYAKAYVARAHGLIFHFSISTFNNTEVENGTESNNLFNPTAYNMDQWVSTAVSAKAKYCVLTAKHHGGFCLWPTATTSHSIASSSPWYAANGNIDIVGQFCTKMNAAGIKPILYFSIRDELKHPGPTNDVGTQAAYRTYLEAQMTELATNYPLIGGFWLDGGEWYFGSAYPWPDAATRNTFIHGLGVGKIVVSNSHVGPTGTDSDVVEYEGSTVVITTSAKSSEWVVTASSSGDWFWKSTGYPLKTSGAIVTEILNANDQQNTYLLDCAPDTTGTVPTAQVSLFTTIAASLP